MQKPGLVVFLAIVYNECKLSDPKPSLSPPVVIPLRFFDPPETLVLVIMSWVTQLLGTPLASVGFGEGVEAAGHLREWGLFLLNLNRIAREC